MAGRPEAGIFPRRLAKCLNPAILRSMSIEDAPAFHTRWSRRSVAQGLRLPLASRNLFRAALFSIVLTLASGADTSLYCALWCHSVEGMAGGCEHYGKMMTAPRLVSVSDCSGTSNPAVFVGEATPRSRSAPHFQSAVVPPPLLLTPFAALGLSRREVWRPPPLDFRPTVLALRI